MEDTSLVLSSTNTNLLNLDYASVKGLAREFYQSGVFADTQDEAKAVIKIMAGQELGLAPLYSMRNFYMIPVNRKNRDGTWRVETQMAMSAQCMGLLLRRSHYIRWETTVSDKSCTIKFEEKVDGEWKKSTESIYTMEDARKAKLVKPDGNWEKNPQSMLFARALSQGAKRIAPDLLGTAPYVPADFSEVPEVIDLSAEKLLESASAPDPTEKKKGKAKKTDAADVVIPDIKGPVEIVGMTEPIKDNEAEEVSTAEAEELRKKFDRAGEEIDNVAKLEVVDVDTSGMSAGDLQEQDEDEGIENHEENYHDIEAVELPKAPSDPALIKNGTQLCQYAFKEMGYQPKDVLRILDVKGNLQIEKKYTMPEAYYKLWKHYCQEKK